MPVTLPEPFASIPRHQLLFETPSPIQHLPRISAALGGKVEIYAKRDDCNSPFAFGGNKTRKLEYLVPDALAEGATTLISIGGVQSNHTRQVAACRLVQERWVEWDDPAVYGKVGNIQLSRLMGADVILNDSRFGIEHKKALEILNKECRDRGEIPYYIPAGASDHPLGGLGFARWAFEVVEQEKDLGVFFDTIVVCCCYRLLEKLNPSGTKRKVIGIDASAKPQQTFEQVLRIAKFTGAKIGLKDEDITEADVILDERYHAGIYGIPDETTLAAIRFGMETEAFVTDPVYEGKSLAGMMDLVRKEEIKAGSTVLYVHLGGQLANSAYAQVM
ncbi:tryptophan synthase beta subunit-like PLP-dependent enzyme [Flagelloscypha sp. PMI_526]|nr:tryptophan synthase beta subunit-like PLP-dependent enzyme [Flagelloscypha sp. PMI_526]